MLWKREASHQHTIYPRLRSNLWGKYYLFFCFLPVLVGGEKKLKTGEKIVPSRDVRGGLLAASTGTSIFPFAFKGLLSQVIVSEGIHKKKKLLALLWINWHIKTDHENVLFSWEMKLLQSCSTSTIKDTWSFLVTFRASPANPTSSRMCRCDQVAVKTTLNTSSFSRNFMFHLGNYSKKCVSTWVSTAVRKYMYL